VISILCDPKDGEPKDGEPRDGEPRDPKASPKTPKRARRPQSEPEDPKASPKTECASAPTRPRRKGRPLGKSNRHALQLRLKSAQPLPHCLRARRRASQRPWRDSAWHEGAELQARSFRRGASGAGLQARGFTSESRPSVAFAHPGRTLIRLAFSPHSEDIGSCCNKASRACRAAPVWRGLCRDPEDGTMAKCIPKCGVNGSQATGRFRGAL
jgi:hypothetical protein